MAPATGSLYHRSGWMQTNRGRGRRRIPRGDVAGRSVVCPPAPSAAYWIKKSVLMFERTSPLSVTARLSIVVSTVGCGVTPTCAAGQARAFDQRRPAANSGVHPDHLVGDHGHPVRDATLVFEAPHPQHPATGRHGSWRKAYIASTSFVLRHFGVDPVLRGEAQGRPGGDVFEARSGLVEAEAWRLPERR